MAAVAFYRTARHPSTKGDEVIAVADLYGGAYRLLTRLYAESGIKVTFADLRQPETLRSLQSCGEISV